MSDEYQELLHYLDTEDFFLKELTNRTIELCASKSGTEEAITELIKKADDYGEDVRTCENVPFCNLLLSFAYWNRGDQPRAVKYAEDAATQYSRCGNQWNRALSLWGKAVIFRDRSVEQAIIEYKSAHKLFNGIAKTANFKGFHERFNFSKKITARINEKINELEKRPPLPPNPPVVPNVNKKKNRPNLSSASIVYGVYDIGHASANGVYVMDDQQICEATIEEIKFDDVTYSIFNLREGARLRSRLERIIVGLKVAGNSMNQASPVSIEPDDFILVDVKQAPETGNIVFAGLKSPPTPAERAGIIKRYTSNGFESESTESIGTIPLNVAEIRGVVIAVAKCTEEKPVVPPKPKNPKVDQKSHSQSHPPSGEARYPELLGMAKGDEELVERLIKLKWNAHMVSAGKPQ